MRRHRRKYVLLLSAAVLCMIVAAGCGKELTEKTLDSVEAEIMKEGYQQVAEWLKEDPGSDLV